MVAFDSADTLAVAVSLILLWTSVRSILEIRKARGGFRRDTRQAKLSQEPIAPRALWLLLPAFREQQRIADTIRFFAGWAARSSPMLDIRVYVVTTAKENGPAAGPVSTSDVVRETISSLDLEHGRVAHLHFPGTTGWKPHQLNYAVRVLADAHVGDAQNVLVGVYDADARPDEATLEDLSNLCTDQAGWPPAAQQLSLYYVGEAAGLAGVLARVGALWQTRWTLAVERRMLSRSGTRSRLGLPRLSWMIGSGLFVRLDVLRRLGGFTERFYTEDFELGYRMSANQVPIRALGSYVEATAPDSLRGDILQKALWFNAYLDYWHYGEHCPEKPRWERIWLSFVGGIRGLIWLATTPVMALCLAATCASDEHWVRVLSAAGIMFFSAGEALATWLAVRANDAAGRVARDIGRPSTLVAACVLGVFYLGTYSLGPYIAIARRLARPRSTSATSPARGSRVTPRRRDATPL